MKKKKNALLRLKHNMDTASFNTTEALLTSGTTRASESNVNRRPEEPVTEYQIQRAPSLSTHVNAVGVTKNGAPK